MVKWFVTVQDGVEHIQMTPCQALESQRCSDFALCLWKAHVPYKRDDMYTCMGHVYSVGIRLFLDTNVKPAEAIGALSSWDSCLRATYLLYHSYFLPVSLFLLSYLEPWCRGWCWALDISTKTQICWLWWWWAFIAPLPKRPGGL